MFWFRFLRRFLLRSEIKPQHYEIKEPTYSLWLGEAGSALIVSGSFAQHHLQLHHIYACFPLAFWTVERKSNEHSILIYFCSCFSSADRAMYPPRIISIVIHLTIPPLWHCSASCVRLLPKPKYNERSRWSKLFHSSSACALVADVDNRVPIFLLSYIAPCIKIISKFLFYQSPAIPFSLPLKHWRYLW